MPSVLGAGVGRAGLRRLAYIKVPVPIVVYLMVIAFHFNYPLRGARYAGYFSSTKHPEIVLQVVKFICRAHLISP